MIALLVGTALALAAADGPGADAELAGEVSRLARQLDAPQLAQRDDAERKLLGLGPAALPLLPAATERTSAEAAARLARIAQRLMREQAAAAAQATLVTLKGRDLPLSQVLAEIARQTGNPIVDHREVFGEEATKVNVTVDFDKTPFWRAIDQVLDQAGLTLYPFAGERGEFVIARPPGAAPRVSKAFYAGLARLEPVRFEATRDLRNQRLGSLRFFMDVAWEPRLQPFAILQPLGTVSAESSSGEAIAVGSADAEPEAMIRDGISAVELEVPLALPKRSAETIRTLKGKLVALVPGPLEEFRFDPLPADAKNATSKRPEQRKGGTTVSIEPPRKNNDVWEVALKVRFEAPSTALESHRSWVLDNEAFFLGPSGDRILPGGFEQTLQNKEEMGINYFFELKDDPSKLSFVYRTPITILELPIDYEFHDLLLP